MKWLKRLIFGREPRVVYVLQYDGNILGGVIFSSIESAQRFAAGESSLISIVEFQEVLV